MVNRVSSRVWRVHSRTRGVVGRVAWSAEEGVQMLVDGPVRALLEAVLEGARRAQPERLQLALLTEILGRSERGLARATAGALWAEPLDVGASEGKDPRTIPQRGPEVASVVPVPRYTMNLIDDTDLTTLIWRTRAGELAWRGANASYKAGGCTTEGDTVWVEFRHGTRWLELRVSVNGGERVCQRERRRWWRTCPLSELGEAILGAPPPLPSPLPLVPTPGDSSEVATTR